MEIYDSYSTSFSFCFDCILYFFSNILIYWYKSLKTWLDSLYYTCITLPICTVLPNKYCFILCFSAGCGRTGTVCAIDYSWDVLKLGVSDHVFVNIFLLLQPVSVLRMAIQWDCMKCSSSIKMTDVSKQLRVIKTTVTLNKISV